MANDIKGSQVPLSENTQPGDRLMAIRQSTSGPQNVNISVNTLLAATNGAFMGVAEADTNPGVPDSARYYAGSAGVTYANFKDAEGNSISIPDKVGDQYVVDVRLIWMAGSWKATWGLMDEPELDGLATEAQLLEVKSVTDANFDRTDNYVLSSKSYDNEDYSTDWGDTGSVFSGWETPVGKHSGFSRIKFKVRARTTAITQIDVRIVENTRDGNVVAEKSLTVNIAPSQEYDVTVDFDSPVVSNQELRLQFSCNQLVDRYGYGGVQVYPVAQGYQIAGYKINGVMSGDFANASGQRVTYVEFYSISSTFAPKPELVNAIKGDIPELVQIPGIKEKTDNAIEYEDITDNTAIYPKANASYDYYQHSTFSAWGFPIGAAAEFSSVTVPIRARSATPITQVRFELRKVNKTGELIAFGTKTVNIPVSTIGDIQFDMGSVIENPADDKLWFAFWCNAQCDVLGVNTIATIIFPYPDYPRAAYAAGGNMSASLSDISSGQFNGYVEFGLSEQVPSPTTAFAQQIEKKLGLTSPYTPSAEIILPSRIYALEGKETNIYFVNVIQSNIPLALLDIDVTCTKGIQYEKYWRYTPTVSDGGNVPLTISVSFQGVLLAEYTGRVYTATATSGTGLSRSINFWGDSTLASGQPISIIIAEQAGDPMTLVFKGTKGSGANRHEGRSGWKISDYATAGRTFYRFNVSGLAQAPGDGSVWSNNGSQFTVREINLTDGTGYFSAERTSGSTAPAASGALTKVSGVGLATINYSSTTTESGNPLWNGSAVSYSNYLSTNSIVMSSGDWFVIHMGINDVFALTTDAEVQTAVNTMVSQLRAILTSVHNAVAGIQCAICITIPPAISQDAFGASYSSGQTLKRYQKNVRIWQKRLISEFDKDSERTAGNYLVPFNSVIDRDNNFPKAEFDANARNTADKVNRHTNGVHPAQSGYDQMGDQLKAIFKNLA